MVRRGFVGIRPSLVALSNTLKGFEAPNYDLTSELSALNSKLKAKPKTNLIRPLLRIAAILAIGFSVFYITTNLDTNVSTELAAKTITTLPDASTVNLNAESTLTYNKNNWSKTKGFYWSVNFFTGHTFGRFPGHIPNFVRLVSER